MSIAAGAGKLVWKHLEDGSVAFLKRKSKEASKGRKSLQKIKRVWAKFNWGHAAEQYRKHLKELYGHFPVFGMGTVELADLFTDVFIIKNPAHARQSAFPSPHKDQEQKEKPIKPISGLRLFTQEKAHRLFVWGDPGAGKTTFLKHIVQELLEKRPEKVPIFVGLNEWVHSGKDLLEFLAGQFEICGFPDAGWFIEFILEEGFAVVLFDGLDEIPYEKRNQANQTLVKFCQSALAKNTQCVITSRIGSTNFDFEGFTHTQIAAWDGTRIEYFIKKRFPQESIHNGFLKEFKNPKNEKLREFSQTPLLLSLLCSTFKPEVGLPAKRAWIYREAFRHLLLERDQARGVIRDEIYGGLTLTQKEKLYAELAAQSFKKGELSFEQFKLEKQIADMLGKIVDEEPRKIDGSKVLDILVSQHGIITKRAKRTYAFSHLTFQEYYTAKHIADNAHRGALKGLMAHIADDRWRDVFLLTASLFDEADDFFAAMHRAIGDLIRRDETLMDMQAWVERKAAGVEGFQPGAVRSAYWFISRALAHARAHALDRALALALDRALALALDRALARALDRALARALDRARALDLDRARVLALNHSLDRCFGGLLRGLGRALLRGLGHALGRALQAPARIHQDAHAYQAVEKFFLDTLLLYTPLYANIFALGWEHKEIRDLHPQLLDFLWEIHTTAQTADPAFAAAFSQCPMPAQESRQEDWAQFEKDLRKILLEHRDMGHEWMLNDEQAKHVAQYLKASQWLVNCLEVAYVSDREGILGRVLTVEPLNR